MAFNCSYRSLSEQNIRHIYSDRNLRILIPRRHHFKSVREERPVHPSRQYPKRFYDYYPSYRIGLPRAPAFRGTTQQNVDDIVNRICKPLRCEKHDEEVTDGKREKRKKKKKERKEKNNDENEKKDDEEEYADDFEGDEEGDEEDETNKMSPREMGALLVRLQRPTESWERKKYDRDERESERRRKERESNVPKLPPIPSRS